MRSNRNKFLIAAGLSTALAALAHLGCIIFGGDWYRVLGAGEQMATMAEQGHWYPAVVTSGIAAVLVLWSLYAFSGAGIVKRLPFLRLALCVIAGIFLIRAVSFVGLMPIFPENSATFWLVSSSICLMIGSFYAMGTYQRWAQLSTGGASEQNTN